MEQKLLEKVNKMAAEVKKMYDDENVHNDVFRLELAKLYGALELLSYATGKEYIIKENGTVEER